MADIPINDLTPRKQYVASAGQTVFPYDWPAFSNTHFKVQKTVAATGITSTLGLTADYSVTGINTANGGNITLVVGAALNDIITISGAIPAARANDFQIAGDFLATALNTDLDTAIMLIKQLIRDQARSVRLLDEDADATLTLPLKAARLSKFFATDANGNLIFAAGTSANLGPVSAFVNTFLDDADEKTARQTLLLDKHGADVASAATVNLDTTTGDLVDITGSVTITAITLAEGVEKTTRTTGAPLFTNGASLVLPGGANIQAVAGDFQVWRGYAAGVVRCVSYIKASGAPLALNLNTSAVGNVGGGNDDLITFNIPANAISGVGKTIRATLWGTTANNVNAKQLFILFGGAAITVVLTSSILGAWVIDFLVVSTGLNTQDVKTEFRETVLNSVLTTPKTAVILSTATEITSAPITIKGVGLGVANNDIVQEGMLVEILN